MNRKIISRIFAMTAVLTIGWAAWTQQGAPAVRATRPLTMTIAKIKPDLYEIEGGGGNVLAYVTGEGVILVDNKNPGDRFHDAIMEQLKTVTDQPVKYIFNTHYHEDHTGANNKFPDAQIISTLNSRLNTLGPAWTEAYGSNRVPPGNRRHAACPRRWCLPGRCQFSWEEKKYGHAFWAEDIRMETR